MEKLPNKLLMKAYINAKKLTLGKEFCELLKRKISRRGLLIFETPKDKKQFIKYEASFIACY